MSTTLLKQYAAILQQTAEYIYSLEQEKTRLLSQNCQLKRLVNQHEGGELPPKKRKAELVIAAAEEGAELITVPVGGATTGAAKGETAVELKRQLERERALRLILESQVRQLEQQLFQHQQQQIQQTQIFELDETEAVIPAGLQLVAADSLPPVGHTQTVTCSPAAESRGASPQPPTIAEEEPQPRPRLPSVLEAAIKAEPKVEVTFAWQHRHTRLCRISSRHHCLGSWRLHRGVIHHYRSWCGPPIPSVQHLAAEPGDHCRGHPALGG
ncbi:unnamed protein product [Acanthoscelides obtectus]|uniref:Uncharacterized protein n=1 Tax=Acanthoscelides obtectus TaxID=200917 RepID=A0A9P0JVL4_ACAOB|nr:unnamed protein product [Acanthoscelides obtectus]CAK1623769.1 Transcription factor AP-4 [Acanthoscelides obtectus]